MKSTSGWDSYQGETPCNVCKDWTDGYREGKDACKACANWTEDYRGGNTCKLCKDTKIVNAAKHKCLSCKNTKTLPAKISGNGTNSSGLALLPGGYRNDNGDFGDVGANGKWWCSSEGSTSFAWSRYLYFDNGSVPSFYNSMRNGFSVRCLRD